MNNMSMDFELKHFPALENEIDWGIVKSRFSFLNNDEIDESLVSNVSIIPHIGDHYVMIQLDNGKWELPGGTLEEDEPILDGLKREVMEELGGELKSYQVFGQFICQSSAAKPYRPYIPHPTFIRLLGFGEVELTAKPLNPEDGEQVVNVEVVDIDTAVRRFEQIKRHDIADMYKLAHVVRQHNR